MADASDDLGIPMKPAHPMGPGVVPGATPGAPPAWAEGDGKVIGFPVVTDRDLKRLAALTCDLAGGFPLSTADFRRFAGIIEPKPP